MVVIRGVISPLIRLISIITLIITPFITTHEPPSGCRPGGPEPLLSGFHVPTLALINPMLEPHELHVKGLLEARGLGFRGLGLGVWV